MLDILKQIRGYSPNLEDADQTLQKSIPIVGDQLTVERGVNVIEAVQNSYTPEEKLEGIHMEIADWHTAVTFLNVRECIISKHLTCTFKKKNHTQLSLHSQFKPSSADSMSTCIWSTLIP